MLVRQRSAKKSRLRATSQVECAAPRRRPGLPRTPRSFLPVGPSPPRFWGLAAPRGATRGNRLNSGRLASASNRTLDCLVSYTPLALPRRARLQPSSGFNRYFNLFLEAKPEACSPSDPRTRRRRPPSLPRRQRAIPVFASSRAT